MENAGRRDITSQAEETSAVELSHNLTTVTTRLRRINQLGARQFLKLVGV